MSYSANILVPRQWAQGKLGAVMCGCNAPTIESSLALALDVTMSHYLNPECAGYSVARITIDQVCDTCGGCGQVRSHHKRLKRLIPCKACKGAPIVEVFSTVDLSPTTPGSLEIQSST